MADRVFPLAEPGAPPGELNVLAPHKPGPGLLGRGAPALGEDDDLFAAYQKVAGERGEQPALVIGPHTLSHAELAARAKRLADRLAAGGIAVGSRIAVMLPRSVDVVLTLLACLRLGAVYCPLSPDTPTGRLQALLARLRPAAILTDPPHYSDHRPTGVPVTTVADPVLPTGVDPDAASGPPGIGYILHTSGSTGVPKAVPVPRSALANLVAGIRVDYRLAEDDRVLQFAQPHFDVALEEILPTLIAGGTVVLAGSGVPSAADLAALLTVHRITVANLPTSYAMAVLPELPAVLAGRPCALRLLVVGGERVSARLARQARQVLGDVEVINAYGVTEAAVTSTTYHWLDDADDDRDLAVGRPLPGVEVAVLDADHRPQPAGMVGEIMISGAGVAIGYLDDPEQTAARFVEASGGRGYLTGDLGYWRPDRQLCFVGRRDNQVKLNGHRIELEEIEAVAGPLLNGAPRAVVMVGEGTAARLVGFVESATAIDVPAITAGLADRLPRPLLPTRWLAVPRMPSLAGGKPDRRALMTLATSPRWRCDV